MKTMIRPLLVSLCFVFCAAALKAQSPRLSSLPGAPAVIYLDFDGHTVEGTSWNWNGPIFCGGSGLNADQITEIFNRVSEDYRPFAINITTDSTIFLSAPISKRLRVIFTVNHEWYGASGGVAMVGSFTWGNDTPAFVFTTMLNFNVRIIAEAGAHEAGHTLGLYHQSTYNASCVQTHVYNAGQGTGEIGWAPIMGNPNYQNLTRWNKGPDYNGCNSIQDELSQITSLNNIGYRNDDHQSKFARATNVNFNNYQFEIAGVIEQNGDEDLFKVVMEADGRFILNALPFNVGPNNSGSNLDLMVSLYKRHTFLNSYNPVNLLNSVVDTVLEQGTYYFKIEGRGNIYAPQYASLGSYTLQGSLVNAARPAGAAMPAVFKGEVKDGNRPRLLGNIVSNLIVVSSPATYDYTIVNINGDILLKGRIESGNHNINIANLANGMYLVRFHNQGSNYIEKLLKQ